MTRVALLALLVVSVSSTGAAGQTLTLRDARMGYSMSDLIEVNQDLKRELGTGKVETDPAHEICLLKLMQAEELSFRGILDLSTSVNVVSQMQTPKDENAALQGATIEARWLQTNIADAKAGVKNTISLCQQYPDAASIGQSLITALDASADATGVIVGKTQNVRIDTGDHQQ
jgi:hypothetical protein